MTDRLFATGQQQKRGTHFQTEDGTTSGLKGLDGQIFGLTCSKGQTSGLAGSEGQPYRLGAQRDKVSDKRDK